MYAISVGSTVVVRVGVGYVESIVDETYGEHVDQHYPLRRQRQMCIIDISCVTIGGCFVAIGDMSSNGLFLFSADKSAIPA